MGTPSTPINDRTAFALAERKESLDLTKGVVFLLLIGELYVIFIFSRYENL